MYSFIFIVFSLLWTRVISPDHSDNRIHHFRYILIVRNHNQCETILLVDLRNMVKNLPSRFSSIALVGSSINNTLGFFASARAIAPRCCSPPDSSLGYFFALFSRRPLLSSLYISIIYQAGSHSDFFNRHNQKKITLLKNESDIIFTK